MKNCVYIIPDENKIDDSDFYMETAKNHLPCFQAFSDKYRLGYHFRNDEYQEAPLNLAKDGHLVIKIEETSKSFICYYPKVITDRQNNFLHNNIMLMMKYSTIGCYAIKDNDNIEDIKIIEGMNAIMHEADRRNLLYDKNTCKNIKIRKEDKNVR